MDISLNEKDRVAANPYTPSLDPYQITRDDQLRMYALAQAVAANDGALTDTDLAAAFYAFLTKP